MKGTYINTIIMMAVLAGKRSRRIATQKETIISLKNHKIIWSKSDKKENNKIYREEVIIL